MRTKLVSESVRENERVEGRAGSNVAGSGGDSYQFVSGGDGCDFGGIWALGAGEGGLDGFVGARRTGPLSRARASRRMLWRRWSCEDMKGAEWRSPVQRVMSTQSRDWLRRVRSWESEGRIRGWDSESWRWVGG